MQFSSAGRNIFPGGGYALDSYPSMRENREAFMEWSGVVLEFGSREKVGPTLGVVGTKDVKVGLNLLVCLFSLFICLGVVSSGRSDVVLEESSEFPH